MTQILVFNPFCHCCSFLGLLGFIVGGLKEVPSSLSSLTRVTLNTRGQNSPSARTLNPKTEAKLRLAGGEKNLSKFVGKEGLSTFPLEDSNCLSPWTWIFIKKHTSHCHKD